MVTAAALPRGLTLLIDPDRATPAAAAMAARRAADAGFAAVWIGGTFLHRSGASAVVGEVIEKVRAAHRSFPILAILGLSSAEPLLDHRLTAVLLPLVGTLSSVAELFHQAHRATPALAATGIAVIPIGYLAVGGGGVTSAAHGLQGVPIPPEKTEIAETLARCIAFTGGSAVYLDSGSGASQCVPPAMVRACRAAVPQPLIVGGGIASPERALLARRAGADIVVIGTAFERNAAAARFAEFVSAVGEEVEYERH